jgi:hypothetical protein
VIGMSAYLRSVAVVLGAVPAAQGTADLLVWDLRRAEHLWNRAGFGANTATLERALAIGLESQVDEFTCFEEWIEEPHYARRRLDGETVHELLRDLPAEERKKAEADPLKYLREMPREERDPLIDTLRAEDRAQVADFLDWWVGRMLAGVEPLRERMTLFWHGYFTSSMEKVQSSYEMIHQNQLFRRHALGSFRQLLHGVTHDAAMLAYLDNTSSKKQQPNENFARELMELYTLGEGHFSEEDVREVARAFTGWGRRNGHFHFEPAWHDDGPKCVLGVEGNLQGEDVVEILLRQKACPRHLAHALLAHFEGCEPSSERLEIYAAELRASDYRIDAFLRRLFLDPEFYGDQKRANRIASPLDFLVGSARRVGGQPEPGLIVMGALLLGQRLFFPPGVRGWEGGQAWATGSSLLLRGELTGLLLGRMSGRELLDQLRAAGGEAEEEWTSAAGMGAGMTARKPPRMNVANVDFRALERIESRARINLIQRLSRAGAMSDAQLAHELLEELLAIPVPIELAARVEARLAQARADALLGSATWAENPDLAEPMLRELAQGILTQPEAQMD